MEQNKGKINVSLDSGDAETYRAVKGVDKFERVLANIGRYSQANPANIELKYIIYEKNNDISQIRKFIAIAKGIGVKTVQFSFDFREQNAGRISRKSLMAAAFLILAASAEDINVTPFFVDARQMNQINTIIEAQIQGRGDDTP